MDPVPTIQKRPWHLLWFIIPMGILLFFTISIFGNSAIQGDFFNLWAIGALILSFLLLFHLIILIMIIAKKVLNKWILRGSKMSRLSIMIGIFGGIISAAIAQLGGSNGEWGDFGGVIAIMFVVFGCAALFILGGVFFAIGFFKRNSLIK